MTFKAAIVGVIVSAIVSIAGQTASASKQVIHCDRQMNVVLFGLRSNYGEIFNSGLALLGDGRSQATITERMTEESSQATAFYSGTDYDGNAVYVKFPKAVIGKSVGSPFPAFTKIVRSKTKKEMETEIRCISSITE